MKATLALAAALLAFPLFAGGPEDRPTPEPTQIEQKAEWPNEGDTVYLSAKLDGKSAPTFFGAKPADLLPLDSCVPVRVIKRADSDFFRIKDTTGKKMLEGSWIPRMHRTEKECREMLASKGQPHLEAKGFRYLLLDEAH